MAALATYSLLFVALSSIPIASGQTTKPAQDPTPKRYSYQGAIRDYEGKNYESAQIQLLAILKEDPNHVGARSYLNYVQAALKNDPGRTMRGKFKKLIIPQVDFDQASLGDIVDFLREKSRTLSKGKVVPNILIPSEKLKALPITLRAKNLPLSEVLFYVGQVGGVSFRYEKHSVVVRNGSAAGTLKFRRHDAVYGARVRGLRREVAKIRLPKIQFDKAQISDIVEYLESKIAAQTGGKFAPNIILLSDSNNPVTLSVDNMPLASVLRYVGDQCGIHFSVEPYAIVGSTNRKAAPPLKKERPASAPIPFSKEKTEDELIFGK